MRVLSCLSILSLSLAASCALETGDDEQTTTTDQEIVGGEPTVRWDAVGFVRGDHGRCSGTLIAPNIFLTAAHCTYDGALRVGFGAYGAGQIAVTQIIRAPGWVNGQAGAAHDVAVLVLAQSSGIAPIPVAGTEYPSVTPPGRELRIIGYGDTESGLVKPDPTPLPVERKTAHVHTDYAQTFELGTSGINGAGCFGDSGGPIMDLNGTKVYGVSSLVYRPCTSKTRNIYAAVGHEGFIAAAINNNPPQPRAAAWPFWRYWNSSFQDHFYTIDRDDVGAAAFGYHGEGFEGRLFRTALPGTTPVYRYWNGVTKDHFYTIYSGELGYGAYGYLIEKIEGYVFPRSYAGTVPLHRYWSASRTDHFYTVTRNDAGLAAIGYAYEGNIGYVYP